MKRQNCPTPKKPTQTSSKMKMEKAREKSTGSFLWVVHEDKMELKKFSDRL